MKKLFFLAMIAVAMFASCQDDDGTPTPVQGATNTITIYEGPDFTGNHYTIYVRDISLGKCYSLHTGAYPDWHDKISSIKADLKPGLSVVFREHVTCTGISIQLEEKDELSELASWNADNILSAFIIQ